MNRWDFRYRRNDDRVHAVVTVEDGRLNIKNFAANNNTLGSHRRRHKIIWETVIHQCLTLLRVTLTTLLLFQQRSTTSACFWQQRWVSWRHTAAEISDVLCPWVWLFWLIRIQSILLVHYILRSAVITSAKKVVFLSWFVCLSLSRTTGKTGCKFSWNFLEGRS